MSYTYYKKEWGLPDTVIINNIINKYIGIKHNYDENNCFTIINDIYTKELNKPLDDSLDRVGTNLVVDKRWFKTFTTNVINKETENFKQINLPDLVSFDILLFKDGKNRINHFGMYTNGIEFLHLPEKGYSRIDMLDDYWRGRLYGCYRKI